MIYVKVLVISCVLSACGSTQVKQQSRMMPAENLELADAQEEAIMYRDKMHAAQKQAEALNEQIDMLKHSSDDTFEKLGKCNSLITTYENVLLQGNQEEEQSEEEVD